MFVKSRFRSALAGLSFGALALGLVLASQVQAQTYTPLVNFSTNQGGNGIANPSSQIVTQGEDGEMYFTSVNGGFYGTFFKVSLGGTPKVLNDVGYYPNGGATLGTDGYYYGVTFNQGGWGTIWKVSKAGEETILYTFIGNGDGKNPVSSPIEGTNGLFYGTVPYGGANNYSTAYSISSKGQFTLLHTFDPTSEGQQVQANLVQGTDGNFYGMAPYGGANGDGTIFKMTPTGTVTVLHNFSGTDGETPWYGLVQASDGNFYGTTFNGGVYGAQGVVFQITPSGQYTKLHDVMPANGDGKGPGSVLTLGSDGKLYGVTASGNAGYAGTIFNITTEGTFTTLYTFCQSGTCTDGYGPQSAIQQNTNGIFYGTTSNGGDLSCGNDIGCGNAYSLDMGLEPFVKLVSTSGAEASKVGILGQAFDSATTVEFGGVKATKVTRSG
ncbi:MAG: choice-of-anchor tandem repeat GloVer-containing protein, partial [Terriglobales bacterium]